MNVAGVRRMTKAPHKDHLLNLPEQRMTLRCVCGWYLRNVLQSDRERTFEAHKANARHTRWQSSKERSKA